MFSSASRPGASPRDPHDVALREQPPQLGDLLLAEVDERRGVEDAHERVVGRRVDDAGEELERVAAVDLDRPVLAGDLQRRVEPRVSRELVAARGRRAASAASASSRRSTGERSMPARHATGGGSSGGTPGRPART